MCEEHVLDGVEFSEHLDDESKTEVDVIFISLVLPH
jgi:hypothetical protein